MFLHYLMNEDEKPKAPVYLADLLKPYVPPRVLRSRGKERLLEPETNLGYGDRAFSVCGDRLWNELPEEVKCAKSLDSFKRKLKTYLFREAYE